NIDIKDFKNVDIERVKEVFQERKDIAINVGILLVTVFMILYIWGGYRSKVKDLNRQKVEFGKKIEVYNDFQAAQKNNTIFIKKFSKGLSRDQLVNNVSDLSIQYGVQISSFSPAKEKKDEFSKIAILDIEVSSEDYASMVQFIHAIEQAQPRMKVQEWKLFSQSKRSQARSRSRRARHKTATQQEKNADMIKANIRIESERLNDG
ncbi:hypothetical protein MNBD_UNCLBAC01-457, partial [hydrothermal vent metagenome]